MSKLDFYNCNIINKICFNLFINVNIVKHKKIKARYLSGYPASLRNNLNIKRFILQDKILDIYAIIRNYSFGGILMDKILYINRKNKEVEEEKIPGEKYLKFLYQKKTGELLLYTLISRKIISSFYGFLMKLPFTKKNIQGFVSEHLINMSHFEKQMNDYKSFNDFFIRKLKDNTREINLDEDVLISPADSKVLVYENLGEKDFYVKGIKFNLQGLLNDSDLAKRYYGGTMAIFRLAPADYHRFHFPCDGFPSETKLIKGLYFSVSPLALKEKAEIFLQNKRTLCLIDKTNFGKIAFLEIGATMVGSIRQTYYNRKEKYTSELVFKGQEKGYFEFGGSSLVMIFEKDKIIFDKDLIENTLNSYETKVFFGESIARKYYADNS